MGKKILIVDDESDILETLKYRIEANGFEVSTANNGMIALEMVRKEKFDLILLDIRMPIEDGVSAFEKLKKREETKDIPVIFITAFSYPEVKEKVLSMGAADYILKNDDEKMVEIIKGIVKP